MKKRYLITLGVIAVAFVGGIQWGALRGLERENELLTKKKEALEESESAVGGGEIPEGSGGKTIPLVAGVSSDELNQHYEELVAFFLKMIDGERSEEMREQYLDFTRRAQSFSTANITEFANLLQNEERFPESDGKFDDLREEIFDNLMGDMIAPVVPFQTMGYLLEHPERKETEFGLAGVFNHCLEKDLPRALALYEEVAAGNPKFLEPWIRTLLLGSLAAHDPDKMLSMALDPKFQVAAKPLENLAGLIGDKMETPADSLRFLQALARAEERESEENVELLEKVRTKFVQEAGQQARQLPFEEAKVLVSQGFNQGEQYQFFSQISRRTDLPDIEKWGDWFLDIKAEDWVQWAGDRPEFKKHPLVALIERSGRSNREFGEQYLQKISAGELRDEATLSFAWRLADWEPEGAASYLAQLPKSKGKRRLAKKIEKALK